MVTCGYVMCSDVDLPAAQILVCLMCSADLRMSECSFWYGLLAPILAHIAGVCTLAEYVRLLLCFESKSQERMEGNKTN